MLHIYSDCVMLHYISKIVNATFNLNEIGGINIQ
jgi:hypothetical protein